MTLEPRALRRSALRVALFALLLAAWGAVGEGLPGAVTGAVSAALIVGSVSLAEQVGQERGWSSARLALVLGAIAAAAAVGALLQAVYLRGLWAGGGPAAGVAALSSALGSGDSLRTGARVVLVCASLGATVGYLVGPREQHEGLNVYMGQLGVVMLLSWTYLPTRREADYILLLPQLLIGLVLGGILAWGAFGVTDWIEDGLYPQEDA
ncbi:MAG TPA: hypothetical protein DEA08_19005 [Planctomycetes bacterium]|nr:hypothetical protein [Planctomycetota bacterium]